MIIGVDEGLPGGYGVLQRSVAFEERAVGRTVGIQPAGARLGIIASAGLRRRAHGARGTWPRTAFWRRRGLTQRHTCVMCCIKGY